MIYTIIVFAFFVGVFGVKNYLRESKIGIPLRITHLIIPFILFQYYFGTFRWMLWDANGSGNIIYAEKARDKTQEALDYIQNSYQKDK